MRIAFDATAVPRLPAGAAVYTLELIRALADIDRQNEYVVFARPSREGLDDLPSRNSSFRVHRVSAPNRPLRLLWEQAALPRALASLGIDLLHSPHHTAPLRGTGFSRVLTIHDMTFHLLPERYPWLRRAYFRNLTRLSARKAAAVIVPSNAVKSDVLRILRLPEDRVTVIQEAPGAAFRPPEDESGIERVKTRHLLPPAYILSVGSLEPGKNRARLIEAFAQLRRRGIEHRLVIAGQRAWRHGAEFDLVRRLGLETEVLFLGYVPAADLPALYAAADLFVFPSLYEGFGLPVLEAMACGTPVVTSARSALPEVVGDAGLLVDPYDVQALSDAMEHLLRDSRLRAALRERGLRRAREFSWERAARETLAVYEQTVRPGGSGLSMRGKLASRESQSVTKIEAGQPESTEGR